MKLGIGSLFVLSCLSMKLCAAESFPLWEKDVPGALGNAEKEIPTLTVFKPAEGTANGAAMVICPGGGYGGLAPHEGKDYAEWLAKHGITGFVLKYRLGSAGYRHPVMLNDVARAVRLVRSQADKWGLDRKRVGIMGSSAGGHLASTLLTHFDDGKATSSDSIDQESSRPDLGILCYPVITFGEFTHAGSKRQLLGGDPSPELVRLLSNELQVTKETPPCFLWHTIEDKAVPVENSLLFASALRRAGVPFSLHVYEKGAHGLGLGRPGREAPPWAEQLLFWFKERAFLR